MRDLDYAIPRHMEQYIQRESVGGKYMATKKVNKLSQNYYHIPMEGERGDNNGIGAESNSLGAGRGQTQRIANNTASLSDMRRAAER